METKRNNTFVDKMIFFILGLLSCLAIYSLYNPEVKSETIEVEFLEIDSESSKTIYAYHDKKILFNLEISDYEKNMMLNFLKVLKRQK